MRVITARFTKTELQAMESLISLGHYKSRTGLIREAVMRLMTEGHKLEFYLTLKIRKERMKHGTRKRKATPA